MNFFPFAWERKKQSSVLISLIFVNERNGRNWFSREQILYPPRGSSGQDYLETHLVFIPEKLFYYILQEDPSLIFPNGIHIEKSGKNLPILNFKRNNKISFFLSKQLKNCSNSLALISWLSTLHLNF